MTHRRRAMNYGILLILILLSFNTNHLLCLELMHKSASADLCMTCSSSSHHVLATRNSVCVKLMVMDLPILHFKQKLIHCQVCVLNRKSTALVFAYIRARYSA